MSLYWAQALAGQSENADLAAQFAPIAAALTDNEAQIISELNGAQGSSQEVGGYYQPDDAKAAAAMRPSAVLNDIIDGVATVS